LMRVSLADSCTDSIRPSPCSVRTRRARGRASGLPRHRALLSFSCRPGPDAALPGKPR
jgi:hypothetical protein